MELLASAWATAVWAAAVIFFTGLVLGGVTLLIAIFCTALASVFDKLAERHERRE